MKRFLAFTLVWFIATTIFYWGTAENFTVMEGWNLRAIFMGYFIGPIVSVVVAYLYFWSKNRSEYAQSPPPYTPNVTYNFPNPSESGSSLVPEEPEREVNT